MDRSTAKRQGRPVIRLFEVAVAPTLEEGDALRSWTVGVALGVFAAVLVFWGRVLYSDTYTALAAGRLIANSGLPHHDTLTVAGYGRQWVDEQWLAHIIYYEAWNVGGYLLLGAVSASLIAAAFGLLHRLLVGRGVSAVVAFGACGLAFAVSDLNLETRPQSFGYPLFLLLLWLLLRERSRPGLRPSLFLCWPVLLLWGNLHGSVLLGLAACGSFALVEGLARLRAGRMLEAAHYAGWLLGGLASALVTPYGTEILRYYPSLLGNPNLRYILEWQHASLGGASIPFLVLLGGTSAYVAYAWRAGGRPDPFLAMLLFALTAMGMTAVRYQAWFSLVAVLVVCDLHGRLRQARRSSGERSLGRLVAAVGVLAALGATGIAATTPATALEHKTPPAALLATAKAAGTTRGPILTDDLTGSALPWLYPKLSGRVAFDSRTEIYPPDRFVRLVRFITLSHGWRAALQGYDVISVTCVQGHPALCKAIPRLAGWRVVFATSSAVVAVRR